MKILIVKTSSLGDIIHCFPILTYLKKKFPHALIDWVVEKPYADLLESNPHINRVHCIETKVWRKNLFSRKTRAAYKQFIAGLDIYDVVFDLQGNIKSGLITWKVNSPQKVGFGRKTVSEWPNLLATNNRYDPPKGKNIREDYLFLVQSYFQDFSTSASQQTILRGKDAKIDLPRLLYMVCPGSAWQNKQLPTAALKRFLQRVQEETFCTYVYIWGNEKERALVEELQEEFGGQVVDKLPLSELQSLMRQMDLVIAMDSLPLHLAGTTDTPTFSVFGPSLADKYRPIGSQHSSIQGACPYGRTFEKRCPILRTCPTGACTRQMDEDVLFEAFPY